MEGALNWPRRSYRHRGKARKTLQKTPGEAFGVGWRDPSCQRSPPKQQPPVRAHLGAQRGPLPSAELHLSPTAAPPDFTPCPLLSRRPPGPQRRPRIDYFCCHLYLCSAI